MTHRQRFQAGALGALAVVLGNLLLADRHVLGTSEGVTLAALLGLFLRDTVVCCSSGLYAWRHESASRYRLFGVGATAAVSLAALVNGNALAGTVNELDACRASGARYRSSDTRGGSIPGQGFSLGIEATAHASEQIRQFRNPRETAAQQFLRGLLSLSPDVAGFFVAIDTLDAGHKALEQKTSLQKEYPSLNIRVFEACGSADGCHGYFVTVGGQVSLDEALLLRQEAARLGLEETEIRDVTGLFPNQRE